jgi:acetolactate synthase-1/2/3 large subunit
MKEVGWTARVLVRYILLQVPGTALLVLILIELRNWFDLPAWFVWGLVAISVTKDVILFPFVWRAYDWDRQTEVHSMVGRRGVAKERLAPSNVTPPRAKQAYAPSSQPLEPENLCRMMAAFTPENAIFVNEAATTGLTWNAVHAYNAAPHTMLFLTGGAIGQGLPNALGAALACPDRRVIAFQADGSGLYTLQALWSMARESANVTIVVCANRRYRILQAELTRAGIAKPGPKAWALTDLTRPVIDWNALAKGFGRGMCTRSLRLMDFGGK